MKFKIIIIALFALIIGLISGYSLSTINHTEVPFSLTALEKPSPHDWIKEEQIHVLNDKIIIEIEGASWASYTDTNSMDPLLDETANGIEITPNSTNDIHIGDIVAYTPTWTNNLVVHRVTEINEDEYGWYAIVKPDNSTNNTEKIRFDQIKFITIGVLY